MILTTNFEMTDRRRRRRRPKVVPRAVTDFVRRLKIDSESRKCPIFIGSLQTFGEYLEKNKNVGFISDQNWLFNDENSNLILTLYYMGGGYKGGTLCPHM